MKFKKIKNNIISIDSSYKYNIISIIYNNIFHYKIKKCNNNHEKNILYMIESLLKCNNIQINNFQIISFVNGPGSFTGIRLAASIAQGLSIPNNALLIGISSLKILAEQAWRLYKIKNIIICKIANKKNFFWVQYKRNKMNFWIGKELILNINQILIKINSLKKIWYITGSGFKYLKYQNNPFLHYIKIKESYEKDLISITMMEKQKKNFSLLNNIKLNYLNNPNY
ncbi:tRNA (adenosine(37)-N6)-threonylcarbamoyltransferase complex dimerization subunit type 1 TsaB [Buchnera aphidicola]|uniref:tRNA threonylcarbamoyladenosine biosynthesis protein TsaB n=1 Tax=Buchnera aphidicola (Therioaphis trifolii) TaxID=1241884 RepID=A0A4D6YDC5_9GAMM|nr:tRNA (adenosine(37)-N6)-threonylcarbamoyltransferase complex dimerization subunit type 1 TsaB [Buchnera aphidicola]QCI27219.1 tRNA (adenosine(37)-N6)-threonylcarbamoyltransferase complex dimerization subunit type 1 TsaB [Buchnera aphidicola (Therioaphis trifolii)]